MQSKTLLACFVGLGAFAVGSQTGAAEYSRTASITRLVSVSHVRPAIPETQNIVRVYVAAAAWGPSSCRQDAFDIRGEDYVMYSLVMDAWKNQRPLTVYVDDSTRIVANDSTCAATAVLAG
jgi:hypothetical protein